MPNLAHIFAQAIAPSTDWPWWAMAVKAALAAALATAVSMNHSLQWMLLAMLADMTVGLACGVFKRGGISARAMGLGVTVKLLQVGVVAGLSVVPWLNIDFAGQELSIGSGSALWFAGSELVSIVENLDELGVPLPPFLRPLIQKVKDITGATGHKKEQ